MEIRDARTDEVERITELWLSLAEGQRAYGSHILCEDNRIPIRESILRATVDGRVLVAEDQERLIGLVEFAIEHGRYAQDAVRGSIQNLYVRPEYRNDGLGSSLLDRAEDRLEERGVDVLAIEAMAENTAALRFYRERGYTDHRVELERRIG